MKEHQILFKGPLVRAILEGRKTVTRRAVKIQPRSKADIGSYGLGQPFIRNPDVTKPNPECPYGRPGDRLWVRETFGEVYEYCDHPEMSGCPTEYWHIAWKYRADGETPEIEDGVFTWWKPSIHMPRAACRILLEITDVRVERLQDISDKEIEAEGIDLDALADGQERYDMCHAGSGADGRPTLRTAWRNLWESTGGDWNANPWVWVVEFKRVMP